MRHLHTDSRILHTLPASRSTAQKDLVCLLAGFYLDMLSLWHYCGSLLSHLEAQGTVLLGHVPGNGMVLCGVSSRAGGHFATTRHEFASAGWCRLHGRSSLFCAKPQFGSYHLSLLCLGRFHFPLVRHLQVSSSDRPTKDVTATKYSCYDKNSFVLKVNSCLHVIITIPERPNDI